MSRIKLPLVIKQFFPGFSFGALASAFFLISLFSGIFLALFYDPVKPYESITRLLLYNPWASFWRNLHYWSAQFFMLSVIIHFWGYLRQKNFIRLRPALWFRLVSALMFVFLVMFTGFLLKGDEDSRQASLIFRNLLYALPWLGSALSHSILGKQGQFILPYVHHIATTSIILILIIREHAHKLWTGREIFIVCCIPVILISSFFVPPLHDGIDPLVKGPWYFVALQELLHWINRPLLVWTVVLIFLSLVFIIIYIDDKNKKYIRYILMIFLFFYIGLTITAVFFRGENWEITWPGKGENRSHYAWRTYVFRDNTKGMRISDSIRGRESCLHCHDRFTGLSAVHSPEKIGCYCCHGGNAFSLDKEEAHRGMRLVPGNLQFAARSCGSSSCHPDIIARLDNSLMTRLSGLIAVDRWVFGEAGSRDGEMSVHQIKNTAAGMHLKNLCLSCHLGGLKDSAGAVTEKSRGGGCLACHLNYSKAATDQLNRYSAGRKPRELRDYVHPSIDVKVSNDHCFGCHSRSGRISVNYEGWAETLKEDKPEKDVRYRVVEGVRLFEYVAEDVHHKAGMGCTDCHGPRDVMGDGSKYRHKEEAVAIRCDDCHLRSKVIEVKTDALDYEAAKIRRLWGMDTNTAFLKENRGGGIILGGRVKDHDSLYFVSRFRRQALALKRPSDICYKGNAHNSLHCSACHAGWAPRCIACHTSYNEREEGLNLLTLKPTKGRWEESVGGYNHTLPVLGVRTEKGQKTVIPVVPGMIMTLDQQKFNRKGSSFHRLFAPLEPHTTMKSGRSCRSCHNDPLALGYGQGELEFRISGKTGRWYFTPAYAKSKEDGLPQDAWTGFMHVRNGNVSTRSNVKPFSITEQQNILQAGACMTCHKENSAVMLRSLENFQKEIQKRSDRCAVAVF